MNNRLGRYVLAGDVITPSGMNLDISLAVAQADLARFSQRVDNGGVDRYTYARVDFWLGETLQDKVQTAVATLLDSLLGKLPKSLKPIPLLLSLPDKVDAQPLVDWLEESQYDKWISQIDTSYSGSVTLLNEAFAKLDHHDALLCVAVDSLVDDLDQLIESGVAMGNKNPWGVIPSEGAAGLVVTKKNIVDTLKLKPLSRICYTARESGVSDRRGMMRLTRKAAKACDHLGSIYSDMSNDRTDTEDYGFAIGARAEQFTNPQNPFLINELWGTLGKCSALALMATFNHVHRSTAPASLMLFGRDGQRAIMQLELCA